MNDKPQSEEHFNRPHVGECPRCHLRTWNPSEIGSFCKMELPMGEKCQGVFVMVHDLVAATVPDDATKIRARCPVCKAVAYKTSDIGTRCTKNDKRGRRCYGMYEGSMSNPEIEEININGDKVIEFARAVRALGDLFESMNIVGIKELFLMGQKCETIERVIERQKVWWEAMVDIQSALNDNIVSIDCGRKSAINVLETVEHVNKTMNSASWKSGIVNLEHFAALCDRIDAHRKSGTLDIVAQLTKPTTPL